MRVKVVARDAEVLLRAHSETEDAMIRRALGTMLRADRASRRTFPRKHEEIDARLLAAPKASQVKLAASTLHRGGERRKHFDKEERNRVPLGGTDVQRKR